jgi:hypothetical protein
MHGYPSEMPFDSSDGKGAHIGSESGAASERYHRRIKQEANVLNCVSLD